MWLEKFYSKNKQKTFFILVIVLEDKTKVRKFITEIQFNCFKQVLKEYASVTQEVK